MKTNQIQFLLYAEKNKRETDKMNKLIKGLSDEQLETLIQMTETNQESNIIYEKWVNLFNITFTMKSLC